MRRLFIDSSIGQLHVREHGERGVGGVPLIMLHAAPGSAAMLSALQEKFSQLTWAIDLPGMGDSVALPEGDAAPTIADYTDVIVNAIQRANLGEIDVYGTLSGVRVALDMAARPEAKVRRVVLDGIGIPKPEQLAELLAHYAPPFVPDINGNHLMNTFLLCRDQYLFYPWYARDAEHRRPNGLPSAALLHAKTMESLKSAAGFGPLIRTAFSDDVAAKLLSLKQPALISADGAPTRPDLPILNFPPAEPLTCPPDLLDQRAEKIAAFLAD